MLRKISLCDEGGEVLFEGVSLLSEPPPPPGAEAPRTGVRARPANDNARVPHLSGTMPVSARPES
jgi:hypothetical protein